VGRTPHRSPRRALRTAGRAVLGGLGGTAAGTLAVPAATAVAAPAAPAAVAPAAASAATTPLEVPVSGTVTSLVGAGCSSARPTHTGVDISAPIGRPVYAAADGVARPYPDTTTYGLYVDVVHSEGWRTRYAHLSRQLVLPGQAVRRGQLIGLVGVTGNTTGPHLHWEVRDTRGPRAEINGPLPCRAVVTAGQALPWSLPVAPPALVCPATPPA